MMSDSNFELRQTLSPILYQPIIGVLILPLLVLAEHKLHGWQILNWDIGFILLYFIGGAFLCWSWARTVREYRVFLREGQVGMHPTGAKADVLIPIEKIESIENEFSFVMGRVPRRIAIYSHNSDGNLKYVDVSLKHFVRDDIRKLLDIIHEKRPDLSIPKLPNW